MKTPLALLLIFTSVVFSSFAQKDNYIPPSPEAGALAKSLGFPAGANTGVPSINVPLYQVEVGGLTLPINLSYHAGGFKVNEQSGFVGLGWSMSLDLQITRQVNGFDDFTSTGSNTRNSGYYFNNVAGFPGINDSNSPMVDPPLEDLLALSENDMDYQPDRFQFKLLNKSGTFYFRKSAPGMAYPVTIPTEDILIELLAPITASAGQNGTAASGGFKITDTDGTMYWFNKIETSQSNFGTSLPPSKLVITSWKCSKIVTASKKDTINLIYEPRKNLYAHSLPEKIEVLEKTYPCQGAGFSNSGIVYPDQIALRLGDDAMAEEVTDEYPEHYKISCPKYAVYSASTSDAGLHVVWNDDDDNTTSTDVFYRSSSGLGSDYHIGGTDVTAMQGLALTRITFRAGAMDFLYDISKRHLARIKVSNVQGDLVKNIIFVQTHMVDGFKDKYKVSIEDDNGSEWDYATDGVWYLDGVLVENIEGKPERYGFAYNKYPFNNHSKGSDLWGGVLPTVTRDMLGSNSNSIMAIPYQNLQSEHVMDNICGNIDNLSYNIGSHGIWPSLTGWTRGIIKKITYPTGGYTEFNFELNEFWNARYDAKFKAGGLRVESISYYDGRSSSAAWQKKYKYGRNEDGIGFIHNVPMVDHWISGDGDGIKDGAPEHYAYEQIQYYTENISNPPNWNSAANETKTTFLGNPFTDFYYASGAPIYYEEVAEYHSDLGEVTGKTVYKYDEDPYNGYNPNYRIDRTDIVVNEATWHMGKLKSEIKSKKVGDVWEMVHQKNYHYTEKITSQKIFVGKIFQIGLGKKRKESHNEDGSGYWDTDDFKYYWYGLQPGYLQLTQEEEIWKESDKELYKVTDYEYDNGYVQLPTRISTTLSNGLPTQKLISYPTDYTLENSFTLNLRQNHMYSLPVEEITVTDNQVTSAQITRYRSDNSGLIDRVYSLETVSPVPLNDFSLSKEISENTFAMDPGYKEKSVILYNDRGRPTMVVPTDNVSTSYIWGYNNTLPIAKIINAGSDQVYYNGFEDDASASGSSSGSHTGVKYKTGSFTVPFVAPTQAYFITYWYFSNGTWNLSPQSPYTNNQVISAERIDDVRVYPKNALMTSYTYKPLVGMTSMTDANNTTTYYDYDALGRLKTIRDNKGNILKTHEYFYR